MRTIKNWNELIDRLSVGQTVSGVVKEVHPFGVIVDIDEAFDAVALVPYLKNQESIELHEYPKEGSSVNGTIQVFSEKRNINFNQIYISLVTVLK